MSTSPRNLASHAAWVFDLDNTLYCASSNLFGQIDVRMKTFIARFLDLEPDEAFKVQKRYFREYGTTLRGLMDRHDIDPRAFLDHVHDIDLDVVRPNPVLDKALENLEGRKIIFTNADVGHAERVMERLGVSRHFEAIFDIVACDYIPKPEPAVYRQLVERFELDPKSTVMVEDMARNLKPAADIGMTTVWVHTDNDWGQDGADGDHVHHVTDDLSSWLSDVSSTS
ncbi:MAG: pyrimidine 5'-nucleotidase [Rhodospirillales bacterium]|nr:pyrimidine 5'-nucleotidase [Rhodospirillales bacterium]